MRKLKKSELSLLLVIIVILLGTYVVQNTSIRKQGFIRSFSKGYESWVVESHSSRQFYTNLALAAESRLDFNVTYDGSYKQIPYPNGDVDPGTGVCTDVVIRSYRALGIDLQQLIHEDMADNFLKYPKIWRKLAPDTNIDHRRVPNQMVFYRRQGETLPITDDPLDYKPGELVAWQFGRKLTHIGIVSTKKAPDGRTPLIVHNIGRGPEISDILFSFPIIGHFRYMPAD